MNTLRELTYVDNSAIHGKGLYARVAIGKGTLIGKLQGKPTRQDGCYVLWLSETEGFEVSCNLKYINHADNANACYYDDLTVMAIRDIAADEEITHNYDSSDW